MAEYTFKAYEHVTSTLIDSTDTLEKTVIVSPAYVMETPTHAFARENHFSKTEIIYTSTYTCSATELKFSAFVGYIKGDIGIHFVEILAPLKIDISGEADGTYKICLGVAYTKGQATIVKVNVGTTSCVNGTLIGTIVKTGGGATFAPNDLPPPKGGETLVLYTGTTAELPILSTGSTGSGEHMHISTY
jgi:hypothetical protein